MRTSASYEVGCRRRKNERVKRELKYVSETNERRGKKNYSKREKTFDKLLRSLSCTYLLAFNEKEMEKIVGGKNEYVVFVFVFTLCLQLC